MDFIKEIEGANPNDELDEDENGLKAIGSFLTGLEIYRGKTLEARTSRPA